MHLNTYRKLIWNKTFIFILKKNRLKQRKRDQIMSHTKRGSVEKDLEEKESG